MRLGAVGAGACPCCVEPPPPLEDQIDVMVREKNSNDWIEVKVSSMAKRNPEQNEQNHNGTMNTHHAVCLCHVLICAMFEPRRVEI